MIAIEPLGRSQVEQAADLERRALGTGWGATGLASERERPDAVILAASDGETLQGFVLCRQMAEDEAELLLLVVEPDSRRRGIGGMLVRAAIAALAERGVATVHLSLRAGNDAARRLYEARGFRVARRAPRAYRDPDEDGIEMAARISIRGA